MDVSSVKLECAISSGWKLDVRMVCGPPKHNPNKILFLSISFDIISPTKVYTVKAMVFPVVTNGCKSWTIKKTERWRIDAFELWCYRRLLRVPWTTRRSNQSILKEINPENSLEGVMLKLQNFGYLMQRADSLEKTLILGKIEGRRRRGWQRMRRLDGIIDSMDMSLCKLWERVKDRKPGVLQSMGLQRVQHDLGTEQQEEVFHFLGVENVFKSSLWAGVKGGRWQWKNSELEVWLCDSVPGGSTREDIKERKALSQKASRVTLQL